MAKLCSSRAMLLLLLISAIPVAYILRSELSTPPTHVYHYHASGLFRESAAWDESHRRFLVSFVEGGIGEVKVRDDGEGEGGVLEEVTVVKDADVSGNASVGIEVDAVRKRVVVVYVDLIGRGFGAVAAYDLGTWERLFLTRLAGPGDEKSMADDVAIDEEGNAYVTDCLSNKIWKVGVDGKLLSTIRSPLFTHNAWYKDLIGLNGIVYHPDGFLLVIHTVTGDLYKIVLKKDEDEELKLVKIVQGSLRLGDGIALVTSTKLVVAGNPSGRLVESTDGWETAAVVGKFSGPLHRLATTAVVKDGKVYLSHLIGVGYPKTKHALVEAVFST
ncbi:hypothetical protein Droror1_Dr00022272 [Drosera rotundifolia]